MNVGIIRQRLAQYQPKSYQDLLNAMKEICQELALAALSSAGFFKIAAFQGGTCLRILHGLRRFSEDLDFILVREDRPFRWKPFLEALSLEFEAFDLHLTLVEREDADRVVKRAFIKEDSFGKVLELTPTRGKSEVEKIRIKLEIDTHPPTGSSFKAHLLDFPHPFTTTTQDLPSLFASKCHALLCRPFIKGRDWFDFVWYVSNKVPLNFDHLQAALQQAGPFQGKEFVVNREWFLQVMESRIDGIDWEKAADDVKPFLKPPELSSLDLWDAPFFQTMRQRLGSYL